jgi:hypothetical protein
MAYLPIISNPYIVGNPIKTREMFFGREEDFRHIREILLKETKGIILTLAGERRSGKTSILFQVMNGRLGEEFLPFFIDMQAMAAIENTGQFLERVDVLIRAQLGESLPEMDYRENPFREFEKLILAIQQCKPGKAIVFLIDEYELIENKIEKGQISDELIIFLASLIENHNVLFIFTGSHKLEDRKTTYWRTLFSKSQYRKITFLRKKDALALITEPCKDFTHYNSHQLEKIYRITAGQPFYTQIFCQNMIDRLRSIERNEVTDVDIDFVVAEIVRNPMPQMIYFWQELPKGSMICLSALARLNYSSDMYASPGEIKQFLKGNRLSEALSLNKIKLELEDLYRNDILEKREGRYRFMVDLFRDWIRLEQDIWKVAGELNLVGKKKGWARLVSWSGIIGITTLIVTLIVFSFMYNYFFDSFDSIVSCHIIGSTIMLNDAKGNQKFISFDAEITQFKQANITGNKNKELIIGLSAKDSIPAQIIAFSSKGKEIWRYIQELNYPASYTYRCNKLEVSDLEVFDKLITVTYYDQWYYPSVFVILNSKGIKQKELWHPGRLTVIKYFDSIFVLKGVNNSLEKSVNDYTNVVFGLDYEFKSGIVPKMSEEKSGTFKPLFYYMISPLGAKPDIIEIVDSTICYWVAGYGFFINNKGIITKQVRGDAVDLDTIPQFIPVDHYWPDHPEYYNISERQ